MSMLAWLGVVAGAARLSGAGVSATTNGCSIALEATAWLKSASARCPAGGVVSYAQMLLSAWADCDAFESKLS